MSTTYAPSSSLPINHFVLEDSNVIGNVTIKPRRMAKLVVGMYENTMPMPKLSLEFGSGTSKDSIAASLIRTDGDDFYTLVYQFQNYGDVSCHVTVKSE